MVFRGRGLWEGRANGVPGWGLWVGRANGVPGAGLRVGGNVIQSEAVGRAGPMAGRGWGLWVGRANGVRGVGLVGGQSQWCAMGGA